MEKLISIAKKLQDVILRYPLVLLMSASMTAIVLYLVDNNYDKQFSFILGKFIILSSLGISVMFALKMLAQRIGKEWLLQSAGLLFLFGYYFVLPKREDDWNEPYFFLLFSTFILAHLLGAFVPFLSAKSSEKSFWEYNKNLFVNFVLTGIFSGVLTAGVELAVVAVQALFNLHFNEKMYLDIFVTMSLFGNTLIFLLFSENGLSTLEEESEYPVVLKFFTQFILIPLLLIYSVILYLYTAKIVIQWQLPHGWVSYLILAYSSVGILALLLVHPLKEISAKSWVKAFSKIFYFSLIPLVVLLFTAIFTRVLEYGFTEARYFVLLLAVWLACVVLSFTFVKKATIRFIPVSLFLFGLFALIFPYFNTFSVAKRSQKHEFEKLLTENHLLKNGKIDFEKQVTDSLANDITSKVIFLNKRSQDDYLKKFIPKTIFDSAKKEGWYEFYNNFKNVTQTKELDVVISAAKGLQLINSQDAYNISGYDFLLFEADLDDSAGVVVGSDTFKLRYKLNDENEKHHYTLTLNGKHSHDFFPQIVALFAPYKDSIEDKKVDGLELETDLENYHIKAVFTNINKTSFIKGDSYWTGNVHFFVKKK